MHAGMCMGPPCMTRGPVRIGMGADWGFTSQLLCLLAEVLAPSTVAAALQAVLQCMSSCVCEQPELLTSQFASLFADSTQTSKELQQIQQEFADRQTK